MTQSRDQKRDIPVAAIAVGAFSLGAGFFATTSEVFTLLLFGFATWFGVRHIVR